MKRNRLLLLCDAFLDDRSGAAAAQDAARYFSDIGFEVTVFGGLAKGATLLDNKTGYDFSAQAPFKSVQHIYPGNLRDEFDALLKKLSPEVIFILGCTYSKPLCILESSVNSKAKVIYMPWNQDFYCARSYGYYSDKPCESCLSGGFKQAIIKNCVRKPAAILGMINRVRLREVMVQFDEVICSSQDQANALGSFLDRPISQIEICPLFFDPTIIKEFESTDGDYFLYYAQAVDAKGWHLLPEIISNCKKSRFVLCPPGIQEAALMRSPGLEALIDGDRVKFVNNLNWKSGLGELVANSRGVLIPSIWPTTTEYVLLESLGLGKPVITFNVGVHKDVLTDCFNAMVSPVGDVRNYSSQIDCVDSDIVLRQNISKQALNTYSKLTDRLAITKVLRRVLDIS